MKKYVKDLEDPRKYIFSALSCGRRIRIIEILKEGEKKASEIIPELGIDQSAVSRHLSILKSAGIIASRKEGVNVIYRIADPDIFKLLDIATEIVRRKEKQVLRKLGK